MLHLTDPGKWIPILFTSRFDVCMAELLLEAIDPCQILVFPRIDIIETGQGKR